MRLRFYTHSHTLIHTKDDLDCTFCIDVIRVATNLSSLTVVDIEYFSTNINESKDLFKSSYQME